MRLVVRGSCESISCVHEQEMMVKETVQLKTTFTSRGLLFLLLLLVSSSLVPPLPSLSSKFSSESVGSCFVTFSTFLYILMLVPWLFFGCVKAFPSTSNHGTQVKRKREREREADIRGRGDG